MALLPFLAAGQTHLTKGPYQKNIQAGLYWLTAHQKNDGDLSSAAASRCIRTAWRRSPCARPTA